jgi:hypothetical protein
MSLEELDTQLQVRHKTSPSGHRVLTSIPPDLPHCRATQRRQACSPRRCTFVVNRTPFCRSLPRFSRCKRPPRDPLHLRPTQLPPRSVPDQHRSCLSVRDGCICRWRSPW